MDPFQYELHAIALRASPDYRVLNKLQRRPLYDRPLPAGSKIGIVLDVETTGLTPGPPPYGAEVIELAMLRFAYSPAGTVLGLLAEFHAYRQPSKAIPDSITRLTGITDAVVAGATLDAAAIRAFVEPADLIVAHNAGFDRLFCEPLNSVFIDKSWACSMTQISWASVGVEGTKLSYIAMRQGFFFEAHRAVDDCHALLEILERPLPGSRETALSKLLAAADRNTKRVWALGAPFSVKDQLRERGYRWNLGEDGRPRAWHREVQPDEVAAELRFLDSLGFPDLIEPLVLDVDATLRFSGRLF